MDFLKSVAGKIVVGLVAVGVIAAGISWWGMDEGSRSAIISGSGRIIAWVGIVLVVPWVTFFIIGRVGRMESNTAGVMLVLGYTAAEVVLLAWLFDWSIRGAAGWTFFVLGGLVAAAYNLFACDWIAEKVA